MEKIPTAEEFYRITNGMTPPEMMIEFAKLHVKAALEAASLNGEVGYDGVTPEMDKQSILSAYPLENIK